MYEYFYYVFLALINLKLLRSAKNVNLEIQSAWGTFGATGDWKILLSPSIADRNLLMATVRASVY